VKTSHIGSPSARLPVTRDLTLAYVLSLVVALVMAVASAGGLLYQTLIYPADEGLSFFVQDAINLVAGLPILLGSMWLARRGRLIGLLCWPGALFYVLYGYVPYLIALPFNVLFLPYLLLVSLSAYTITGIVASIDGDAVRQRLTDVVPARTTGGILAGLAIFVIVRQTVLIVTALIEHTPVALLECAVWIDDLTVGCPALLVCGVQLWRRRPLGYVGGAGLLLQYGILAVGVIPIMVAQARAAASPLDVGGVVVLLVMAALCFVPFAFFVRGAASDRGSPPA
jgi:hypothetical protein